MKLSLKNTDGLKLKKHLKGFEKFNLVQRVWEKDPKLWKEETEYDALIKNRLGWLALPESMKPKLDEIIEFANEIVSDGFLYAVVLGMGGSSMAPEVFRDTFGSKENFLKLYVIDTTDAVTIFDIENSIDLDKTLFIVSSKSGSTIEVDSLFRYFHEKMTQRKGAEAGSNFVAITDPDTKLESLATEKKFRKIFTNPADIGGRYSALSFFGLVPASLIGVDIHKLMSSAEDVMTECTDQRVDKNPGVLIGCMIASAWKKGKDKLTFILPYKISSFGYWVEQLIAESTGKELKGILPVEGEATGKSGSYGKDRIFVHITVNKQKEKNEVKNIQRKFPFIEIRLNELYDLGGQFFLWEFATAVAGTVMEINPFDEPNVKESKDNTSAVLDYFEKNKNFPAQNPKSETGELKIYFDDSGKNQKKSSGKDARAQLISFFKKVKKGDYISLMSYLQKNEVNEKLLQKIRELLRKNFRSATTLGYGPRFLHSTGQLHKGGPNEGVFIQIVSRESKDIEIPGKSYTFNILKHAQAIGDYQSLNKHKRRTIKIDLGNNAEAGLKQLYSLVKKSI